MLLYVPVSLVKIRLESFVETPHLQKSFLVIAIINNNNNMLWYGYVY